jgi:hypothetical protein
VISLIGAFTFSNDAQPFVPADRLRQPLNSNVSDFFWVIAHFQDWLKIQVYDTLSLGYLN